MSACPVYGATDVRACSFLDPCVGRRRNGAWRSGSEVSKDIVESVETTKQSLRQSSHLARGPEGRSEPRSRIGCEIVSDVDLVSDLAHKPALASEAEEWTASMSSTIGVFSSSGSLRFWAAWRPAFLFHAIHALDPKVPMVFPRTARDVLSNIVRRQDIAMTLTGLFRCCSLGWGVRDHGVQRARSHAGIRHSFGARASRTPVAGVKVQSRCKPRFLNHSRDRE